MPDDNLTFKRDHVWGRESSPLPAVVLVTAGDRRPQANLSLFSRQPGVLHVSLSGFSLGTGVLTRSLRCLHPALSGFRDWNDVVKRNITPK